MPGLSHRRERFAQEFIKDGNATQAAIRAGFSPVGAKQTGSRLLTNADIQLRIADLRAPIVDQAVDLARISLAGHLTELATLRDEARKAGAFAAAVSAEASRGKVAGFYKDRLEHTGEGGGAVEVHVVHEVIDPGGH